MKWMSCRCVASTRRVARIMKFKSKIKCDVVVTDIVYSIQNSWYYAILAYSDCLTSLRRCPQDVIDPKT